MLYGSLAGQPPLQLKSDSVENTEQQNNTAASSNLSLSLGVQLDYQGTQGGVIWEDSWEQALGPGSHWSPSLLLSSGLQQSQKIFFSITYTLLFPNCMLSGVLYVELMQ